LPNKNVVYISADHTQAAIVKGFLESHNIDAHLFDENVSRMQPFYNMAIGGVKVVVPSHQVKAARKLLKEWSQLEGFDRPVGNLSPFEFLGNMVGQKKRLIALGLAFIWLPFAVVAKWLFAQRSKGDNRK
jgi:hypothetical protein